jgi:hypothetical protein
MMYRKNGVQHFESTHQQSRELAEALLEGRCASLFPRGLSSDKDGVYLPLTQDELEVLLQPCV